MKRIYLATLIFAMCFTVLSIDLKANADVQYQIEETSPNNYIFKVRSKNVTPGFNLENSPGNILSVFRASIKFPAGSTTTLTNAVGAAPFSGLAPTGPNADPTGEYYSYSFSGGTSPISIPNPVAPATEGVFVTLFTFTTVGPDIPVLWAPGDPVLIGAIGTDNLYNALAPSSTGMANNYMDNALTVPVELISFDAVKRNEREGYLTWETATEQNTEKFEIERSDDGKSWARIGSVRAEGFTSVTQNYSFVDQTASAFANLSGDVYYRIRILDFDGYQDLTDVRKINFDQRVTKVTAYPNPASEYTTISGLDNDANYQLVSKDGKIVKAGALLQGNDKLDLSDIPSGVYYINIETESEPIQIPIVKTN